MKGKSTLLGLKFLKGGQPRYKNMEAAHNLAQYRSCYDTLNQINQIHPCLQTPG